jgi:hypothetical protein
VKRGAPESPKFRRLARALGIEPWGAAGILELLWHFTAQHARRGDIGRWSNEDVADAVGWTRDAGELVRALVEARWLEVAENPRYRLVVHDWPDHADSAVHMAVARAREWFFDGSAPKLGKLPEKERLAAEVFYASHEPDDQPVVATMRDPEKSPKGENPGARREHAGSTPGARRDPVTSPGESNASEDDAVTPRNSRGDLACSRRAPGVLPPGPFPAGSPPDPIPAGSPPDPIPAGSPPDPRRDPAGAPAARAAPDRSRTVTHVTAEPEQPRAPAADTVTDVDLAELRARRAARWLLRKEGRLNTLIDPFDPAAIVELQARLTPEDVQAAVAELEADLAKRAAAEREARTNEAMRHEPASTARRRRA